MATPAVSLTHCGCRRGVFLVTPCTNAAAAQCGSCGIPVCSDHARSQGRALLCPSCYSSQAGNSTRDRDSSDSFTSSSYSDGSPSATDDFAGQGGAFGGGGAGGDWAETAADEAGADSADGMAAPFAAEDYAAFDAVSDFDKNAEGGHGFDS